MNLFIVAFLYLGTAIGIVGVIKASIASIFKNPLKNESALTAVQNALIGAGGKGNDKAEPSKAEPINPNEVNGKNGEIAGEGEEFSANNIRFDSSNPIISAKTVNISNGRISVDGPVSPVDESEMPRDTIREFNSLNDENKRPEKNIRGKRPITVHTGLVNTKFTSSGAIRQIIDGQAELGSEGSKDEISNLSDGRGKMTIAAPTVQMNTKFTSSELLERESLPIGNTIRKIVDGQAELGNEGLIAYPAFDPNRHFIAKNGTIPVAFGNDGLTMMQMQKIAEAYKLLSPNESTPRLSGENGRVGISEIPLSRHMMLRTTERTELLQLMRDDNFRELIKSIVESNPEIDPEKLAGMIIRAKGAIDSGKNRFRPTKASELLNKENITNNNGEIAEQTVSSVMTLKDKFNESDEESDIPTEKELEKARTKAEDYVRNSSSTINKQEELVGAAGILLGSRVKLSKTEREEINTRAKKSIVDGKNLSPEEIKKSTEKEKRKLSKITKEEKVKTAREEITRAIEQDEKGTRLLLGEDLFGRVMEKLKEMKDKEDRKKRRRERNNRYNSMISEQNLAQNLQYGNSGVASPNGEQTEGGLKSNLNNNLTRGEGTIQKFLDERTDNSSNNT